MTPIERIAFVIVATAFVFLCTGFFIAFIWLLSAFLKAVTL